MDDRFSVRYSMQRPVVTDPGRFGIVGGGGKGFAATGVNRTQSTAVNYTHLFSPTFIMELRVGVSRYSNRAENLDIGTNASDTLGIKGANLDRWTSGLTSISVGGYADPIIGFAASIRGTGRKPILITSATSPRSAATTRLSLALIFVVDVEELLQTQDAGVTARRISIPQQPDIDPRRGCSRSSQCARQSAARLRLRCSAVTWQCSSRPIASGRSSVISRTSGR